MTASKQIVLGGADEHDLTKLAEYEAVGGYRALAKARGMQPDAVIEELKASKLRGRGGAFFATGMKWSFVPKPDQDRKSTRLNSSHIQKSRMPSSA